MVDQESHEDSVDNSISVTRHKIIFVGDEDYEIINTWIYRFYWYTDLRCG